MKKEKKNIWLKGAVIGAAFGAGAIALAESKLGKKMGKQAKAGGKDFLKYLAPQVKKFKKLGEAEYKKLVNNTVKKYAKGKNFSRAEAELLMKKAQVYWKQFAKKS